mmetsp:Transcript_104825/g.326865  ORF Transcript_104825/g.326865 Transcript_104825/m.326865 type:complete len:214 (-) Transcript_104825:247-888(-)
MAASAVGSTRAAEREAKRSGMEVPRATKVSAVRMSGTSTTQPKSSARSESTAVRPAIMASEPQKHGHPPKRLNGGTGKKRILNGKQTKWNTQSRKVAVLCSSLLPLQYMALMLCLPQSTMLSRTPSTFTRDPANPAQPALPASPPSADGKMITVKIADSSPPSSSGLKRAPSACSNTRKKMRSALPLALGKTRSSTLACETPGSNSRSPSRPA